MEPKDGRRLLLERDPSGVSQQDEGDESRECWSTQAEVESRGLIGLMGGGVAERVEREAMVKEKVSGPSIKEAPVVRADWSGGTFRVEVGTRNKKRMKKKGVKIRRVTASPDFERKRVSGQATKT